MRRATCGARSAELEQSYKLNPKDSSILYALAYANARAGDQDRASQLLEGAKANPVRQMIEGLIQYRRGMFCEAKTIFQDVLRIDPNSGPALTALGRLELLDHNDAEAIRLLERALKINPVDAESTYQLGVLYDRNGRTEEGVRVCAAPSPCARTIPTRTIRSGASRSNISDYQPALQGARGGAALAAESGGDPAGAGPDVPGARSRPEAKAEFAEVRRLKAAVIERDRQRVESDQLMKP